MLLAFLLAGLVLLLTSYIYKPAAPTARKPAKEAEQPQTSALVKPAQAPAPPPSTPATVVSAAREETYVVETDLYRVVLSNRGAVVRSWLLKKYKAETGKPLELVNASAAAKTGYPFSLEDGEGRLAKLNQALFQTVSSDDGLGFEFHYSDGRLAARKSFRFRKDSYLSEVSSSVTLEGRPLAHLIAWRGGFGDRSAQNHANSLHSLRFDPAQNKLIVERAKAAKERPVSSRGHYTFAGIEDAYFAAVFLPIEPVDFEVRTFSDTVAPAPGQEEVAHLGAAVGGSGENRFSAFVGPKDLGILRSVNPKLEQVVDFGWFGFIAKPLFLALNWVNNRFVHNYGWAIVVVTVIINILLLPLKFSSLKSMKKMQALQPQIAAINARYKGISLRDPKKTEQNQEIMDLYKKHGVNPMGGCFPMLVQIPFLYAFYKVLTVSTEMRGAEWLWVRDLSQPEHLPIRILPIAMIITQFIMQKMTPTTTADPTQRRMMLMMPLVLGFMFYGFQSGLVLYWLTGNLVGIAQQVLFNRLSVAAPVEVVTQKPKARKVSRK